MRKRATRGRAAVAAASRVWRQVLPPARKPPTLGQALPLVLFLALFGGACVVAVVWRWVTFTNLWPFGLLALTPWLWWMLVAGYSGLSGARATVAMTVRLLVLAVIVLALAEPRVVHPSTGLSIVYALDVSDSMGEKVSDKSLEYILRTAGAKPERDEAGLVVFGRESAVELPPRQSFPFEVLNTRVAKDGTDLGKALSLAAAVLPEQQQGRIVLISDGVQTEGDAAAALAELEARRIAVDVLPVQYEFPEEVWLERLDLPRAIKVGETYEATVLLSTLQAGRGTLVLRENEKVIASEEIAYERGKNRYALPLHLREPGYYEYAATIEPAAGHDGWRENNTALNFLYLKGEGKVLLVTDPAGDARDIQSLVAGLRRGRRLVEQRSAYEFPRDALSLLPYDAVLFVNVAADAFDAVQLRAVRDAVFNQGVGFMMVGGPNSFGPGGYHRTPVEEALPVSMDVTQKKVLPKGALAIVLHTCEFPEGNVWAKRVAKEAIRVLSAKDEVGLLVYGSGGDHWVFPLTPAGDYERLVTLINQCEPSDMPSFASIMQLGVVGLEANDAAMKHMIIISDGDPSPPPPELVSRFVAGKISVSAVIINPHGGQDVSIMQSLAGATGGRYYRVDDPNQLPSIFIKEAKTLKRSMIQNKTLTPVVGYPSPVLKGIAALPPLHGYVLTSPKERTSVILQSPETEEVEPILATWRFGLGQTAAFTADLGPGWGSDWVSWGQYDSFVQQLLTEISRVERPSHLQLQTFAVGDSGVVLVDDDDPEEAMLEVEAQVNGPRQRAVSLSVKQVGPRRYEGRFPLWGKGRYQVTVAGVGGARREMALGGFALAYSPEYLRFRSDPLALRRIVERTGGRWLTGRETGAELFTRDRIRRESSRPVFDWLLMLLAFLIPLDVAVRRIQLDMAVIRGWFTFRRSAESTETLGALLKRKEKVDERLAGGLAAGEARTLSTPRPARGAVPTGSASTPPVAPPPTAAAEERAAATTTERLLALKRRREKEENR